LENSPVAGAVRRPLVDEAATLLLPEVLPGRPKPRPPSRLTLTRCDMAYLPDPHYGTHPVYLRERRTRMIEAQDFIEAARSRRIEWYACVPCSFLTPLINYVINDERLTYISSANEGDAVATAAGAAIGGQRAAVMIQNSGLGNAVSPLTSLAMSFGSRCCSSARIAARRA
jgi:hypothetical protein